MNKLSSFLQNIFIPLVTAATAAMVAWLNFSLDKVDSELKSRIAAVDIAVKEEASERERITAEREFGFRIYDLVQESIEQQNEKKQEVARQFVIVMVDGELRDRLLAVLEAGGTPSVQRATAAIIQKERYFEQESVALTAARETVPSFNWEDWDYDIFWCESSGPAAKRQAELIKAQLEAENAKGRLRVRELPASVNAKPGYQFGGYVISRSPNEAEQAEALKRLAERRLTQEGFPAAFRLQTSSEQTKWYLSAFVCPVAAQ